MHTESGICEGLFASLKEMFGHCFVSQALGYITAAKYGLSEMELLDILASDKEVSALCGKKIIIMGVEERRSEKKKKDALPDRESNPGLPRDRRRYLPLYYRGSA